MTEQSVINKNETMKEKIINNAIKLFLRNGFRATSVKEITDKTGIAKGTLYLYFKTKEDVLESIVEKFEKDFLDRIIETVNSCQGNFINKFRTYFRYTTELTREHPELPLVYVTMLGEMVGTEKNVEKMLKKVDEKQRRFIKELLDSGKEEGVIRSDIDTDIYSYIILANNAGMLLEWYLNKETINTKFYIRSFRDYILSSILTNEHKINLK